MLVRSIAEYGRWGPWCTDKNNARVIPVACRHYCFETARLDRRVFCVQVDDQSWESGILFEPGKTASFPPSSHSHAPALIIRWRFPLIVNGVVVKPDHFTVLNESGVLFLVASRCCFKIVPRPCFCCCTSLELTSKSTQPCVRVVNTECYLLCIQRGFAQMKENPFMSFLLSIISWKITLFSSKDNVA